VTPAAGETRKATTSAISSGSEAWFVAGEVHCALMRAAVRSMDLGAERWCFSTNRIFCMHTVHKSRFAEFTHSPVGPLPPNRLRQLGLKAAEQARLVSGWTVKRSLDDQTSA
jgi:hypothetical protein